MPLFEYACRKCGNRFEAIVRNGAETSCPACESVELDKLLSVFAVGKADGGASPARFEGPGPCGSCGDPRGPGACGMN